MLFGLLAPVRLTIDMYKAFVTALSVDHVH